MSRLMIVVAALGAVTSSACADGMICTASIEPGVVVEIRDASDGAPIAAGAAGQVRDGVFSDSLRAYGGTLDGTLLSRAGADEREGTYVVEVTHPGYASWQLQGVRVRGDGCHVATVDLEARLVRVP